MRIIVQRVLYAKVQVAGKTIAKIERGLLALLGIEEKDSPEDVDWLCKKLVNMRIFSDGEGKMNLSVKEIGGNVLLVSQFTLHASIKKGNRPSFIRSADPKKAKSLYEKMIEELSNTLRKEIENGEFGADMEVSLLNDGPVTIIMDSKNKE